MAGVESAEEMTNEQLNAMCGGELLRGEESFKNFSKTFVDHNKFEIFTKIFKISLKSLTNFQRKLKSSEVFFLKF